MSRPRIIKAPKILDRTWVSSCGLADGSHKEELELDLSQTERIDSAGICFVDLLRRQYAEAGGGLVISGASPRIAAQLSASKARLAVTDIVRPARGNVFERAGDIAIWMWGVAMEALSVLVEMTYWSTIGFFKRQDIKKGGLGEQMFQLGAKAVGIVALLSFLIGLVLSYHSAAQLRQLGMGIFLAPMVGITMIRQMGPLITAIVLAGRTGSATTAEIATMVVGEEIDALRTMGINPMQYVMAPKFWAMSLTMPLLSIIATFTGILGGYAIWVFYLDISTPLFISELIKVIKIEHILALCLKSIIFAWLIMWIGCYFGFRVRGGAEAVGRETTSSVVAGIFIIIVANALLSFVGI